MEINTFKAMLNGEEQKYDILFTFDSDKTKKSYIVYTRREENSKGEMIIHASIYDKNNIDAATFKEIETKEEWDMINAIIKAYQKAAQKGEE